MAAVKKIAAELDSNQTLKRQVLTLSVVEHTQKTPMAKYWEVGKAMAATKPGEPRRNAAAKTRHEANLRLKE